MVRLISAPVGMGQRARNLPEDVRSIQGLVNGIRVEDGGPKVKLTVDGKCGPKTQDVIQKFQLKHFGWKLADGRVDPYGPTFGRMKELSNYEPPGSEVDGSLRCHPAPGVGGGFVGGFFSRGPVLALFRPILLAAPSGKTPLSQALTHKPDAMKWVMFALGKLERMRAILSKATIVASATDAKIFESANTHFHIDYLPPNSEKSRVERTRRRIGHLIQTYKLIQAVISDGGNEFIETLHDKSAYARAHQGGRQSSDKTKKKIRFCPPYLTLGPMFQTAIIIHEAAHYVDFSIGHFASELPAPNGTPLDNSAKNYAQLTWNEARRNAYSYAQFALHSVQNKDRRLKFPVD